MDRAEIRAEIEKKIKRQFPLEFPPDVRRDYGVFIKPDDPESDCLMAFVRDNDLPVVIFDTGTESGSLAMDEYSLLECDVPCVCSTKDYRIVYDGCPGTMADLKRIEELY
jgi:hypothetical protein